MRSAASGSLSVLPATPPSTSIASFAVEFGRVRGIRGISTSGVQCPRPSAVLQHMCCGRVDQPSSHDLSAPQLPLASGSDPPDALRARAGASDVQQVCERAGSASRHTAFIQSFGKVKVRRTPFAVGSVSRVKAPVSEVQRVVGSARLLV